MRRIFIGAAMCALTPGLTYGYCSSPSDSISFPSAPGSYDRPSMPFCLRGFKFSHTHTCSEWEISRYQNDVEEYLDKLRQFANDAVDAANEAISFAEEAKSYAKCESDDVLDEIQ